MIKGSIQEFSLWFSGLRIWWCHRCGSGYGCGAGLIPGLGRSTCQYSTPAKGSIHQKDLIIINTHTPNNTSLKYTEQKPDGEERIWGDDNSSLSVRDGITRQTTIEEEELSHTATNQTQQTPAKHST